MIALVMAAQVAAGDARFDLLCSGTLHTSTTPTSADDRPHDVDKPFTRRFAVDLQRGLYARAPASGDIAHQPPGEIATVSPGEIVLQAGANTVQVNRSTGGYFAHDFYGAYEGRCERQPFTPFAERQF